MPRRTPWLAGSLAGLFLLAACSSPQRCQSLSVAPPPRAAATRPGAAAPATSAPAVMEAPRSSAQVPPVRDQPHFKEFPSSTVRSLLPRTCVVVEATATTLVVKSCDPAPAPSLFEEAIALGKLRALLSSSPSLPKTTARNTKLQNGTATIPFGKSVPPSDAADAVAAALSVDGVQRVRAVLNAS